MVAIGGIADIVQHWHEMARSRMTQSGHGRAVSLLCEAQLPMRDLLSVGP
jgi:hypothetical protein